MEPMSALERFLFVANIPFTLLLLLWVWMGRLLFGVGGWFVLILPLMVGPFVLIGLAISTVVTFAVATRPRRFTPAQVVAHLAMWCGFFGFGLFLPDFGDAPDSGLSFLTQVFGRSDQLMDLSWTLTGVFAVLAVLGWVAVLATGVIARARAGASQSPGV